MEGEPERLTGSPLLQRWYNLEAMMDLYSFNYGGKTYTISGRAKFLVESANGTSSYTLERGFGCEPDAAVQFYEDLAAGGNRKKRLTLVDGGQRTVVARTK